MGYASYLPKTRFCCYHNTREVATHKIRNTVTQGEGYDRQARQWNEEKHSIPAVYAEGLPV